MNSKGYSVYFNGLFAALTCPCHAIFYVYLLSGTTLGAFLFKHEIIFMSVLGLFFPFFIFMALKSYHRFKMQKEMKASGQVCSVDYNNVECKTCQTKGS